jgi:hypothetical protein
MAIVLHVSPALLTTKFYAFVAESKLKLANIMINLDATERYALFINHYPGLANRIPMAMIASYLGLHLHH